VETENPSACAAMNWKVCKSAISATLNDNFAHARYNRSSYGQCQGTVADCASRKITTKPQNLLRDVPKTNKTRDIQQCSSARYGVLYS
jgi:hypothetical protein